MRATINMIIPGFLHVRYNFIYCYHILSGKPVRKQPHRLWTHHFRLEDVQRPEVWSFSPQHVHELSVILRGHAVHQVLKVAAARQEVEPRPLAVCGHHVVQH